MIIWKDRAHNTQSHKGDDYHRQYLSLHPQKSQARSFERLADEAVR